MNGYWCVLETGQGGGFPDFIHGPYFDREEAQKVAVELIVGTERLGRRDRFQVGYIEIDEDQWP